MNFDIKEFFLDEKTLEKQANLLSKVFKDEKNLSALSFGFIKRILLSHRI